jgi:hypothetical protein
MLTHPFSSFLTGALLAIDRIAKDKPQASVARMCASLFLSNLDLPTSTRSIVGVILHLGQR